MADCCCPPSVEGSRAFVCPVSRTTGKAVDTLTVKALLTDQALRRLNASNRHYGVISRSVSARSAGRPAEEECPVVQRFSEDPS